MGVYHVFKTVQMVPNRAMHHICGLFSIQFFFKSILTQMLDDIVVYRIVIQSSCIQIVVMLLFNSLSANFTKWSNTRKQLISKLLECV